MNQTRGKQPPLLIAPHLDDTIEMLEIDGDSATHALKSLRLRVGDSVELTNGRGLLAAALIDDVEKRATSFTARIESVHQVSRPAPEILLATALPKGERLSTLLDMATQLGVHSVTPLDCEFSVVRYQPKMRQRWQRLFESACRQSRCCWLPEINEPMEPAALVAAGKPGDLLLLGDHHAPNHGFNVETPDRIVVAVGPEGGFSYREHALFRNHSSVRSLSVGHHILRTETAAIAMISAAHLIVSSGK